MPPRAALLALVVLFGTACRGTTLRGGRASPESAGPCDAPLAGPVTGRGAWPGDEHGAVGFVPRREARSFYSGSGGQLWYYLNLYYWASARPQDRDLWIRAEVVASFRGLRRWPDATPADPPPKKTTVEYWQVGASGRSIAIDNHKDFWLASENWCAGAVEVTMTLELGRFQVRGPSVEGRAGAWSRPRVPYVLDHRDYGASKGPKGLPEGSGRFEPLEGEPRSVWTYTIPWSACPAKFVRSGWEGLAIPEIRRTQSAVVARPPREAALTDDR